jgi:plasmid stability protein
VRRVDEELVRRLELRAARNQRSAEAQHRDILKQALSDEPDGEFKELAAQLRALSRGRHHTAEDPQREGCEER